MLSIGIIQNAGITANYFSTDDYYTRVQDGSPETGSGGGPGGGSGSGGGGESGGSGDREISSSGPDVPSEWTGRGAAKLGLEGPVDATIFKEFLEGQLPYGGPKLGVMRDGEIQHRPGWDLTFSAPKSASILYEVGGDKRIFDAHMEAAKEAFRYMEDEGAMCRMTIGGVTDKYYTGNLVGAMFPHDTSRALDPQMHVHIVTMNATESPDGKWRSVTNEQLLNHKMMGGLIYKSALAAKLTELGYEIELTYHAKAEFEIKGVPKNVMDEFSKRSKAIRAKLKEWRKFDPESADKAAILTREGKPPTSRAEVLGMWQKEISRAGFDSNALIEEAKARAGEYSPPAAKDVRAAALKHIRHASTVLEEREAVFNHDDLLKHALVDSLGSANPNIITKAVETANQRNIIKEATPPNFEIRRAWTTPRILHHEASLIEEVKNTVGEAIPIMNEQQTNERLTPYLLKDGQHAAAQFVLTTKDSVVGIQGYAGTGKTTALTAVREIAETQGVKVVGIAPSGQATNVLADTGIESYTHAQHMARLNVKTTNSKDKPPRAEPGKLLWIADESSMISTKQMRDFLRTADAKGAQVVLVGDTKQLSAVESGAPFQQLQNAGMKVALMDEILRQRDPQTKLAVERAISGDYARALHSLKNNITVIARGKNESNQEVNYRRFQAITKSYMSIAPHLRHHTLLISPSNEDRNEINAHIREAMADKGELTGESLSLTAYNRKGITRAERGKSYSYKVGDVIRFGRAYKSLGVEKGEYVTITSRDDDKNQITFRAKDERLQTWTPHKVAGRSKNGIEIYERHKREIQVGDRIRWTRNDRQHGLGNGKLSEVIGINDKGITIQYRDKDAKPTTIDTVNLQDDNFKHWDYAYVHTAHGAQGMTVKSVIYDAQSWRKNLTNQQAFYVTISRAQYGVRVFTDSASKFAEQLAINSGKNRIALDHYTEKTREQIRLDAGILDDKGMIREAQKTSKDDPNIITPETQARWAREEKEVMDKMRSDPTKGPSEPSI
ncbi:MAG: MobF family relaxase [Gammaproteobacteria bacterium]